jgi:hypothetical protein
MTILIYLLCGLLGLVFVTLARMQSVKKDFAVANQTFVLRKFFEEEGIGIVMSIVFIILMAFTMGEWINIKPIFKDYIKIIFTLGGAVGSWAFMLFLGKSKTYIRGVIDRKTDIADDKISNVNDN